MKYTTWMDETTRGILTPRGTELKALDLAFAAAGDTQSCTSVKRIDLATRFLAWANAKTKAGKDWKQSARNSMVSGNKGTVERLFDDLMKYGETKQVLIKLMPTPVPVAKTANNAYTPGKFFRNTDKDGMWHEFYLQEKGNSCVCATVVIVKKKFNPNKSVTEEQVRGLIGLVEGNNLNSGISTLSDTAQKKHDWQGLGTTATMAVKALKMEPCPVPDARVLRSSVVTTLTDQELLDELGKFTHQKPGLIGWKWPGGSGHFTMCCGPTKDGATLIIADPWTGIDYVDNTVVGFKTYKKLGTLGAAIATSPPA